MSYDFHARNIQFNACKVGGLGYFVAYRLRANNHKPLENNETMQTDTSSKFLLRMARLQKLPMSRNVERKIARAYRNAGNARRADIARAILQID